MASFNERSILSWSDSESNSNEQTSKLLHFKPVDHVECTTTLQTSTYIHVLHVAFLWPLSEKQKALVRFGQQ
eukprot:scaffold4963_cov87-Cylindrotheca_fusiformis.AAC.3